MKPKINLDSKIQIEDLESNFWGFFHDKVEENSNRDLLISRFETLKVGEANHRSNVIYKKLSGGLIQKKGGVAIALVDQIKAIATLLGVWKSNNYSLALNFSNPISRLEFQLKDANIHTIITETSHVKLIKKISQPNVKIINYDNLDFEEEVQNPVIEINLDDMFQIVYTSGSTGNPKGVIGDYRYLIRSVVRKTNDTSPSDRFSLYNSFSFPGPVPMIFRSIFSGTPICYYNLQKEGLVGFSDWIRKSEITHFSLTPTLFRNFNQLLSPDESFPSVNTIKLGAEKKLREDFNRLKELFNPSAVFELSFASTETMGVSRGRYPLTHEFTSDILPAGYPLDDIEIFIWDKDQKEVAQGEEGEIVIRGDALARGYWNLPKLTKERFIPDNSSLGMRYYRSGDLGKILPDGQLMHLGRLDHMVKIKGIRIELESIENHTLTYPGITAVASKPFTDSRGIQRLVTYFIAEKDITIPISDLRMHLQERISSQMMPHFFVQVDIFPLTNSGKISTTELPIPQMTRPNLFNPYESAQNPIEEKLVEIWEDYIGIEGIGVTDDFFDVGGDSLIASLLILGIEKKLNQKYPVSLLIKAATIRDQANLIALGEKNSGLNSPLITIRKNGTLPPPIFYPW
ncbi:MAG: non-ribosomal peptide synthetase [Chloroflexi bacterium]|jgi:acyl-coenzyme A synthetase/AMP-(fatty) acid ligase/acyl carrier protein|nr:non-ribosomal peptide synthetase [Chloroflexota bacterium]MBT6987752.1 non-ribosomal peptide synthetase [Chloroflexota bacterium]